MKRTILIIVIAMVLTVLFPAVALAYTDIPVTGNWTCSYEVHDYGVGAGGGTGTLRLMVENTADSHSVDIIKYVSISYATGRDSEFHQTKSVTIAPTRDAIIDFSIPIEEADAGLGLQLWVSMSIGDADDVDGIGVVNGIIFGPEPVYDATCTISANVTTIDSGESVKISYGGAKSGNKPVDVRLYDQDDTLILSTDNMDILYIGSENYFPTETTTYRYTAKLYKPGTTTLVKEVQSEAIIVTVIQPTASPTDTPTPEPETPEPVEEVTPEPGEIAEEVVGETLEPSQEVLALDESNDEVVVVVDATADVEGNGSFSNNDNLSKENQLIVIILVLLIIIAGALVGVVIYLVKNSKK